MSPFFIEHPIGIVPMGCFYFCFNPIFYEWNYQSGTFNPIKPPYQNMLFAFSSKATQAYSTYIQLLLDL